ncbi:uncharacterized protein LOC121274841 isoform X2 [Carcharodon carcharias]|uniref:uncharacterized protein LOC121274841 isoform X2 n=1 Tax=Carcharodon carcharias TaxID=13397 RepID=UPI001B7E7B4D|nr:uncharacterized protein LOC121274841 isoform X2 [Carcharodon carcharias]
MGSAGCIVKESDTTHSILYLRVRTTQLKRTTASHRAFEYSEYHPVMWTLLLIPGFLIADSALTDPCANHTILDQAWRSIYCKWTECTGQWMCDDKLQEGWYQFKSSGGLKIPETLILFGHCSTASSGWLNGSHPTMGEGEVTRTVCFTLAENRCFWTREIKIKNCSSDFVYELKPVPGCNAAYCTDPGTIPALKSEQQSTHEYNVTASSSPTGSEISVADSAFTDPCANHIVLDQSWRSIYCKWTECTGQWMCDDKLQEGWYQFKSSGGLKIPDTLIPFGYCSTASSGWLNGSHPTVGEGEVTRTVCFTSGENRCFWTREIKIKNCSLDFVYELKPVPGCNAAYCTDPGTSPTQEPEEQSTGELVDISASISAKTSSTDPGKTPTPESEGFSTRKSSLPESSSPNGCEISDTDFKTIRVKVTSVRGLNEERARDIIMDWKDQCLIGLKREDIQ